MLFILLCSLSFWKFYFSSSEKTAFSNLAGGVAPCGSTDGHGKHSGVSITHAFDFLLRPQLCGPDAREDKPEGARCTGRTRDADDALDRIRFPDDRDELYQKAIEHKTMLHLARYYLDPYFEDTRGDMQAPYNLRALLYVYEWYRWYIDIQCIDIQFIDIQCIDIQYIDAQKLPPDWRFLSLVKTGQVFLHRDGLYAYVVSET